MIKNVEIQGKEYRSNKGRGESLFYSLSNRFLGSRAVAVLNHWFQSNRDYPYPDDERTDRLAREAGKEHQCLSPISMACRIGITQKQVKKWFANKRVRSQMCYKPLYRSRKVPIVFSWHCFATFCSSLVICRLFVLQQIKFRLPRQPLHPCRLRHQRRLADRKPITITSSITITSQHRRPCPILVTLSPVPIRTYSIPWPRRWWCLWCNNTWWPRWWLPLAYRNSLPLLFQLQRQLPILRPRRRKPTWIVSHDSGYEEKRERGKNHRHSRTNSTQRHTHTNISLTFVCLFVEINVQWDLFLLLLLLLPPLCFCCYFVLSMTFFWETRPCLHFPSSHCIETKNQLAVRFVWEWSFLLRFFIY